MRARTVLLCALLASACARDESLAWVSPRVTPTTPPAPPPPVPGSPHDHLVPGSATPVNPGAVPDAGTSGLTLDDPTRNAHVGRAPRRLDLDQFRASLEQLLGASWTGPQTVRTAEAPSGVRFEPNADLLEFFAQTLGRPDYITTTAEVLEPTVTFAKLANDAVRSVCAAGIVADVARAPSQRILLTQVAPDDTLARNEPGVRRNLAALTLRLWGERHAPDDALITDLVAVFRAGSTRTGATPLDGWRAVCIDLATDPKFLSY